MHLLRTLGILELDLDGWAGLSGRRKPLALLAYLSRSSGRAISRRFLTALLWPGSDDARSKQSLRQSLSELRAVLRDDLVADATSVSIRPGALVLDASLFESHVAASRWHDAIELWHGEFLPDTEDLGDDDWRSWLEGERAALRKQLAFAFSRAASAHEARAERGAAARLAERWLAALPTDEQACICLIGALRAGGRHADAAAEYARFAERLQRDLGVEPSPELRRLGSTLARDSADVWSTHDAAGAGPAPHMVGRGTEFQRIVGAWTATQRAPGKGRVVVVSADEGLGKTRLCDELVRFVRSHYRNAIAIQARAYAGERHKPYGVLRSVLGQLIDAPGLLGTAPTALASLGQLSTEFRARFPHLLAQVDGPSPGEALGNALVEVAAESPLLIVVDDASDADEQSAGVMAELVRRPPASLLLVLTGRFGAGALSALAVDLADDMAHVERIELAPLSRAESLELVSAAARLEPGVPKQLVETLHPECGGSPGQLLALMERLVARGTLAQGPTGRLVLARAIDDTDLGLTGQVRADMLARIEPLGRDARLLLDAAAVAHPLVDAVLLEKLSALEATAFSAALGELVSARMLRPSASSRSIYEFTSGSIRRLAYELMAPSRKRQLHRLAFHAARAADSGISLSTTELARHQRAAGVPPWRDRRVRWITAAALVLIAGISAEAFARGRSPRVAAGSTVVLADVQNVSGDSMLDRALYVAATVGLQESGQVSLFPRTRARETLRLMGRINADTMLSESVAREIAEREDLARVISIAVARFGTNYLLTARLIEPGSGRDLYDDRERVATRDDLLSGLDRLLVRLRRALGESRERAASASLPRVTTTSLEALRAYADGQRAFARRDYDAAESNFRNALSIDTGFALAYAGLADVQFIGAHNRRGGDSSLDRALYFWSRLSEREQLALRIRVARFRGPEAEQARLAEIMARRYPSRDTWYSLGATLLQQRQCKRAMPALRQALAFDSTFANAYIELATCDQVLGDYADAALQYLRAQRFDSTILVRGTLNFEWGHALLRARGVAAAESAYRLMAHRPTPLDRAYGARSLAYLNMYRGRYRAAIAELDSAVAFTHETRNWLSEFRNDVILAEAYTTAGDTAAARRALAAAARVARTLSPDPQFWMYEAHAAARAGASALLTEAEQRAAAAAKSSLNGDESSLALISAMRLMRQHAYRDALVKLNDVRDTTYLAWTAAMRSEAYAALGKPDSARVAIRDVPDRFDFGWEVQDEWSRAPARIARLAERLGDRAAAIQAYTTYIDRWREGDLDIPELIAARRELARLGPGTNDTSRATGLLGGEKRP